MSEIIVLYRFQILLAFLLSSAVWSFIYTFSDLFRDPLSFKARSIKSMCNEETTRMGPGQSVVSYVYFIKDTTDEENAEFLALEYMELLDHLARRILEVYPGWRMRLYTDVLGRQSTHPYSAEALKNFSHSYTHVDICDMNYIGLKDVFPEDHRNIPLHYVVEYGMFWRFLPLGDPTVDTFLSRDLDAYILDREVQPVKDWLTSGQQFHVMRDIQSHRGLMPGGLWGARNSINRDLASELRLALFTRAVGEYGYRTDVYALEETVWPIIRNQNLTYVNDAFRCKRPSYGYDVHPFPTKRRNFTWVGMGPRREGHLSLAKISCPMKCRPEEHKNWKYC